MQHFDSKKLTAFFGDPVTLLAFDSDIAPVEALISLADIWAKEFVFSTARCFACFAGDSSENVCSFSRELVFTMACCFESFKGETIENIRSVAWFLDFSTGCFVWLTGRVRENLRPIRLGLR